MTLDEYLAARGLPALKGLGRLMRLVEAGAAVTLPVGDSQYSRGGGRRTSGGWGAWGAEAQAAWWVGPSTEVQATVGAAAIVTIVVKGCAVAPLKVPISARICDTDPGSAMGLHRTLAGHAWLVAREGSIDDPPSRRWEVVKRCTVCGACFAGFAAQRAAIQRGAGRKNWEETDGLRRPGACAAPLHRHH